MGGAGGARPASPNLEGSKPWFNNKNQASQDSKSGSGGNRNKGLMLADVAMYNGNPDG